MKRGLVLISIAIVLFLTAFVYANGVVEESRIVEISKFANPNLYIIITAVWVVLLLAFILLFAGKGKKGEENKKLHFWLIAVPVILSTLYLGGYTIYENFTSLTGGPVHWHADYQVITCGEKADLVDPKGLSGKVGNSLFHEHNDGRIHIEGTVRNLESVALGEFFRVVGGELEGGHLVFPTSNDIIEVKDGDLCNGVVGNLKVYVNGKKIENPNAYLIYPASQVPPGDCIIVLFDETVSETTDLLCDTWEVREWNYNSFKRPEVTIGGVTWQ